MNVTDAHPDTIAWWAQAIMIGGIVAAVLLPLGAIGTRFGIWQFQVGFLLLFGALVLSIIAVVGGVIGFAACLKSGLVAERMPLLIGLGLAMVILGVMGWQFNLARSVPPIHNVTTDVQDPPAFVVAPSLRGPEDNPIDYDPELLGPLQERAYPWLQPLLVSDMPDAAFARSQLVLNEMGLEVTHADPDAGVLEAVATTFWFGFKDDMVVRIRPDEQGARIDLRSVSRVGQGDLGANARRIAEFQRRYLEGT